MHAVMSFVIRKWKSWDVYGVIERLLREKEMMPLDIMGAYNQTEVSSLIKCVRRLTDGSRSQFPTLEDADAGLIRNDVARELFGRDAFVGRDRIRPNIRRLVDGWMSNNWNRYRKSTARALKGLAEVKRKVDTEWLSKCLLNTELTN